MTGLRTTPGTTGRAARPLIALLAALALALSGCSGEEGSGGDGGDAQQQDPASSRATSEEETSMGSTSSTSSTSMGETSARATGGTTALSGGLEAAQSEAESWNEDAELYSITTVASSALNAEGESEAWLYSFVSESAGSVISIPYSGGEVRDTQGQELPESQIGMLSEAALSTGELIDSPEAIQRSEEIGSYLEENPDAEVSAGVDSTTSEDPRWIFTVVGEGRQEQVPATE